MLDEDDAFLGMAPAEVWEYDVVDERAKDFEAAARNSETVMELQTVDWAADTGPTRDAEGGLQSLASGNDVKQGSAAPRPT